MGSKTHRTTTSFQLYSGGKCAFAKYLRSGKDKAHLLLHILQEMMRNEVMYQTIRNRQRGQDVSHNVFLKKNNNSITQMSIKVWIQKTYAYCLHESV